jgi:hypothetical protein
VNSPRSERSHPGAWRGASKGISNSTACNRQPQHTTRRSCWSSNSCVSTTATAPDEQIQQYLEITITSAQTESSSDDFPNSHVPELSSGSGSVFSPVSDPTLGSPFLGRDQDPLLYTTRMGCIRFIFSLTTPAPRPPSIGLDTKTLTRDKPCNLECGLRRVSSFVSPSLAPLAPPPTFIPINTIMSMPDLISDNLHRAQRLLATAPCSSPAYLGAIHRPPFLCLSSLPKPVIY